MLNNPIFLIIQIVRVLIRIVFLIYTKMKNKILKNNNILNNKNTKIKYRLQKTLKI